MLCSDIIDPPFIHDMTPLFAGGGGGGGFFARDGGGGGGPFFAPIFAADRAVPLTVLDGTLPYEVAGDMDLSPYDLSGLSLSPESS